MKSRVLVVDDEPGIRKAIAHCLEAHGYEVLTADDGKQALHVYEAGRPDLIILDLLLPESDRFEIWRRIQEGSQVPIIILSIKGDELDRAVGFRLGVDDYMVKPFSPSELARGGLPSEKRHQIHLADDDRLPDDLLGSAGYT